MDPGTGHFHILVDPAEAELTEIMAGAHVVIPNDETHVHMGDATTCRELELAAGEHVLVAVVGDGAHFNLHPPVTAQVQVTVQ
jgi:hypothetical protein